MSRMAFIQLHMVISLQCIKLRFIRSNLRSFLLFVSFSFSFSLSPSSILSASVTFFFSIIVVVCAVVVWLWFLRIYLTYFISWRTVIYTTWFFSFVLCEGMWKYVWLPSENLGGKTCSLDLYIVCRIAKSLFSPYRNRIMQEIVIKVANLVITLQEKESTVLHAFFFTFLLSFCLHIKRERKKRILL